MIRFLNKLYILENLFNTMRGSKHNKLVDDLESRLRDNTRSHYIKKYVPYKLGEVDIFSYIRSDNGEWCFRYYEVKSSNTPKNINKGTEQVQRWLKYMHEEHDLPYHRIHGIVVTPESIQIIRHS